MPSPYVCPDCHALRTEQVPCLCGRRYEPGPARAHEWLRDWMDDEGEHGARRYGVYGLPWRQFLRLVWWGFGVTPAARRRAERFRACIEEGRTLRASLAVAEAVT